MAEVILTTREALKQIPEDTVHIFLENYQSDIFPGDIPSCAGFIDFGDFNHYIHPGSIPDGVSAVTIDYHGDKPLLPGIFPKSLRVISMGYTSGKLFPGVIPEGVEDVMFREVDLMEGSIPRSTQFVIFQRNLSETPLTSGIIPEGVTHFSTMEEFNQFIPAGVIPRSVKYLEFDGKFDQELPPGVIPGNVLEFRASNFNREISQGTLPPTITWIKFGKFNREIAPGVLPLNLDILEFGNEFNHPILPGVLPEGLSMISFGKSFQQALDPHAIPSSVKEIFLRGNYHIPISEDLSLRDVVINVGGDVYIPQISYPTESRRTEHEDLVYKQVPEPGTKYLVCENREEHVMEFEFMRSFKKTENISRMNCVYCTAKIKNIIYEQI